MQKLSDFKLNRTLGTGSFGRVLMCEPTDKLRDFMAMKIIGKERVIKTKQVSPLQLQNCVEAVLRGQYICRALL